MSEKRKVGNYCGHGTQTNGVWDSGCSYKYKGRTYTEAELMAPITNACVKYLKQQGIEVVTDAPRNKINMIKQVALSNKENVDVHVAFHCDYSKAPKGTLPLYTSPKGRKLAVCMNKWVLKYTTLTTRGVAKRNDLYELNSTNMPAVIYEVGSIKRDLKAMLTQYDDIGKGAARGICEYLGVKWTSEIYRVRKSWTNAKSQVGAFNNLNSAKAVADQYGYKVYNSKGNLVYTGKAK